MQRITLSIDDDLAATLDRHVRRHGYASRSEALRDILRDVQARERLDERKAGAGAARSGSAGDAFCVATLAYVYDHETRALGQRLTQAQHRHHDLQVATMHVHLDHDSCLEVAILRGPAAELRALADETTSQRGVRHGQLHLIPAEVRHDRHVHGRHVHGRHVRGSSGRTHTHIKA
ncbi:MAG: nickel-responsive transcriptional regulator NikR [Alphaproteobacteria bacterium]|nr:nickel-responsive transcriptional regulator NikR [Alphaproteobacteria bacterium]